jgi:NAD(P)-dependent dehydrogenase (short-subunit alcohol dehydrogenase family)
MRLSGKRVILTGASRGIGLETVKLFSAEGAEILGVARNAEALDRLEREFTSFRGLVGDVSDKSLAPRVAEAAAERWGAVDLLLNNAAIQNYNQGFHAEPLDELERNLVLNVLSAHWLTHALLPLLLRGREPRVINVSSGAGAFNALQNEPSMPAYRLSKYALNGMTMLYAGDLRGKVAVNALDPGWLKTDLGGPNAPGEPVDGARRMLELACKPSSETGKFWYGAEEIRF